MTVTRHDGDDDDANKIPKNPKYLDLAGGSKFSEFGPEDQGLRLWAGHLHDIP